MKNELKLEVAQNPICLTLSDPIFFESIAQDYRCFLSGREPKLVIQIHLSDGIPHRVSPCGGVISNDRGFRISHTYFSGSVDLVGDGGNLYTAPEWLTLALQVFLRNVFTYLLLQSGGLALHALGVLREKGAYVLFGPSGVGKTTAANLSQGFTILSDDLVFLRFENGSYWVHPTPRWGDMQRGKRENRPYLLKAVFKLVKAEEIGMKKCNAIEALSDVITFPSIPADLISPDRLLARFSHLVKKVPFYELRFVKDRSFWPCIADDLHKIGIKNAE